MLVAFLSGNAAVADADDRSRWWHDPDVRARLHLAPEQVDALDEIFREAQGRNDTLTQWRMYQTLNTAQRQQFAQLLHVVRS
jgi:hypothetical protein